MLIMPPPLPSPPKSARVSWIWTVPTVSFFHNRANYRKPEFSVFLHVCVRNIFGKDLREWILRYILLLPLSSNILYTRIIVAISIIIEYAEYTKEYAIAALKANELNSIYKYDACGHLKLIGTGLLSAQAIFLL